MSEVHLKKQSRAAAKSVTGGFRPWLFLLPTLLLIAFWFVRPLIQTLVYTFCDWNMLPGTSPVYVGLANFAELFTAPQFGRSLINTFYYIFMMLPFSVLIPLVVAALIQNLGKQSQRVFRIFIFLPMIMPPVATASVFQWLLHQTNGLVNHLLLSSGFIDESINFFMTEEWARPVIVLISGWKMIGFSTLMFSAAMSNMNPEYTEAAKMDGSSAVRRFFDFTIPLLSPTIMLMIMMSILFASQWTFSYIDVLTQGGPLGSTTNIYYQIYKYAFGNSNVGASAAASVVLLVIFGIISIVLQFISKKVTFYDN